MAGEVIQIVLDEALVLKIAAGVLGLCAFLIVLLFKVVLSGLNKTITNCHTGLTAENKHILEKHDNHEKRIENIEKIVFKPIGE